MKNPMSAKTFLENIRKGAGLKTSIAEVTKQLQGGYRRGNFYAHFVYEKVALDFFAQETNTIAQESDFVWVFSASESESALRERCIAKNAGKPLFELDDAALKKHVDTHFDKIVVVECEQNVADVAVPLFEKKQKEPNFKFPPIIFYGFETMTGDPCECFEALAHELNCVVIAIACQRNASFRWTATENVSWHKVTNNAQFTTFMRPFGFDRGNRGAKSISAFLANIENGSQGDLEFYTFSKGQNTLRDASSIVLSYSPDGGRIAA